MTEPVVLDWDSIVHKNVRSKDGQDAGNVDATDADSSNYNRRCKGRIQNSQVTGRWI
jgi:hypothetical protein